MKQLLRLKTMLLLCALMAGAGSVWGENITGTIYFSNASGATAISSSSVTGNDSQGSTWTITTVGTTSFTANSAYYQVGSSKSPATSITFTTTLPNEVNITGMSAKFGGFSNTAGTVTLKVGDTTIGTGNLNAGTDVTVSNTTSASGNVLTVTVTNIDKGVKVYYISYSYASSPLSSISVSGSYPTTFYQGDEFSHDGMTVTATYEDNTTNDVTSDAEFTGYNMSTLGEQTVTVSYTEGEITKSTNYSITVNEFPKYTVSFSDGGSVTEATGHAGVTLPTRSAAGAYQFVGWSLTDIDTESATANIIPTNETYYPTSNITLYPVYSKTTSQTEEQWLEVTTAPADGTYAICSASYFMKATVSSNRFSNGSSTPSIQDGKLTTAPTNDCRWEIYKASDDYYRIKNESNYAAGNGTKNQGALITDESSDYAKWTITYSSGFKIENVKNKSSNVNYTLRNNSTNGWAPYAEATGSAPRLFKQTQIEVSAAIFTSHPIITTTITLNAACTDGDYVYGTYSNSKAFIVSDDIIVSEIKVEGGKLKVSNYETGDVVPANTGVMVSALEGGNYTVQLTTGGTSVLGNANMLKASGDAGITAANMATNNTKFYRLTMHNGNTIGFWWGATDGAAFDLAANKAYLAVPTSALNAARMGFWLDGEATDVNDIDFNGNLNGEVYDLQGRRVAQPSKGLYIVNGKKVVIK